MTFDQMPHIGNTGGVYYAYGYSGQGVPMACYLGKEAAELIAGVRQEFLIQANQAPHQPAHPAGTALPAVDLAVVQVAGLGELRLELCSADFSLCHSERPL